MFQKIGERPAVAKRPTNKADMGVFTRDGLLPFHAPFVGWRIGDVEGNGGFLQPIAENPAGKYITCSGAHFLKAKPTRDKNMCHSPVIVFGTLHFVCLWST